MGYAEEVRSRYFVNEILRTMSEEGFHEQLLTMGTPQRDHLRGVLEEKVKLLLAGEETGSLPKGHRDTEWVRNTASGPDPLLLH